MGNVPTFSAVLFFEVEVATDNRHFRPKLIEIAKRVKDTKNAQDAEESKKKLVYCRSSPVGDTRMLQSRMLHFFCTRGSIFLQDFVKKNLKIRLFFVKKIIAPS